MAHKVFICHSAKNKQIADAACAALEAHRISCWIAPRDVLGGMEYMGELDRAISDCQILLVIFSKAANDSPQVRREIERSVSYGKDILQFRIEDFEPHSSMKFALSNTHWLDAITPPMERRLNELCQNVSLLLRRQKVTEPVWQPTPPEVILPKSVRLSKRLGIVGAISVAIALVWLARIEILAHNNAQILSSSSIEPPPNIYAQAKDAQVRGDYASAVELYGNACNGGTAKACIGLGNLYQAGTGVEVDAAKAESLFKQACSLGDQSGCTQLTMLQNAIDVLNGPESAAEETKTQKAEDARKALER